MAKKTAPWHTEQPDRLSAVIDLVDFLVLLDNLAQHLQSRQWTVAGASYSPDGTAVSISFHCQSVLPTRLVEISTMARAAAGFRAYYNEPTGPYGSSPHGDVGVPYDHHFTLTAVQREPGGTDIETVLVEDIDPRQAVILNRRMYGVRDSMVDVVDPVAVLRAGL